MHNGAIYNLWQDASHVQGIWRRTSAGSYATKTPRWTTVLDLDALSKREHAHWVWEGATCEPLAETRCILQLSNGGEDAQTFREFDVTSEAIRPRRLYASTRKTMGELARSQHVARCTRLEAGSIDDSGYPYVIKRLRRGAPLSSAVEVFRGKRNGCSSRTRQRYVDGSGNSVYDRRTRDGFLHGLYVSPDSARTAAHRPSAQIRYRRIGRRQTARHAQAAVHETRRNVSRRITHRPRHSRSRTAAGRFPSEAGLCARSTETLDGVGFTKTAAILMTYHNVRGRALIYTPTAHGWRQAVLSLPDNSSIDLAASTVKSDDFYASVTSFLHPTQLYPETRERRASRS